MNESNKHYSAALDCCRWIAALLVVVSHVRHLLLADFDAIAHKSIVLKAFYFVTGLGDEAVIVFFVLSGLLVGGGAARKFLAGRYDARDYAIHRISRIYTVLIPALLIGGLLDWIGIAYFNGSMIYSNGGSSAAAPLSHVAETGLNLSTLLGNMAMIQHWLVPVFGSNGPLWSLASEWWFYCLFWAMLGIASRNPSPISRIAYAIFGIVLALILPVHIIAWFAIWLIGVAMAFSDRISLRLPPLAGLGIFAMVLVAVRLARSTNVLQGMDPLLNKFILDLAVAIGCCLLLFSLSCIRSFRLGSPSFHGKMAGFSYTTYLVHFPLLVFAAGMFYDCFGIRFFQPPTINSALYFLTAMGLLYLYSYFFSRITENKTAQIRRLLWQISRLRLQTLWRHTGNAVEAQDTVLSRR